MSTSYLQQIPELSSYKNIDSSDQNYKNKLSMMQTRTKNLRSKTEDVYILYNKPQRNKRKFIQHSIFLPIIKKNNYNNTYDYEYNSRNNPQQLSFQYQMKNRKNSDNSEQILRSTRRQVEQQFSTTVQYINECERIIQNLKNLTAQSCKKMSRRGLKVRADSDELSYKQDSQFLIKQLENSKIKSQRNLSHIRHNSQQNSMILKPQNNSHENQFQKYRVKTQMKEYDSFHNSNPKLKNINQIKDLYPSKKYQAISNKQLKTKVQQKSNIKKQQKDKQMSESQLKLKQQVMKSEKRQKVLMKFLGKAKFRGGQLQKKILQYKKRKSLEKNQNKQGQNPNVNKNMSSIVIKDQLKLPQQKK